jgi:hypothetical protein
MRVGAPSFSVDVFPWSLSPDTHITSPSEDPENLKSAQHVVIGDVVFWTAGNNYRQGIDVWDATNGVQPFVRWIGDDTKGAADLGTDGVDLVWTYGEGKQPSEVQYPTRSIMTAPFTTDPAALVPRRLRSQPYPYLGPTQFEVGCGYAAHPGGANDVLVVRLSDGASWLIPYAPPDFNASKPIGLTCEHVYVFGRFEGRDSIIRVKLDSLGAPMPPD